MNAIPYMESKASSTKNIIEISPAEEEVMHSIHVVLVCLALEYSLDQLKLSLQLGFIALPIAPSLKYFISNH